MVQGASKTLEMDDLYDLIPSDTSKATSLSLESNLLSQMKKPNPSLSWALFISFWPKFIMTGLFKVCNDLLSFAQPQLLGLLMAFAATHDPKSPAKDPIYHGFIISLGMLVSSLGQAMFTHQYYQGCFRLSMKIDSGLVNQIYKKSLRLSNSARLGYTVGEVSRFNCVCMT